MTDTVLGKGLLADSIGASPPRMTVVVCDAWDHHDWAAAHARGEPWCPVWTELDRIVIGPLGRPGEPGCAWCLEKWRSSAADRPQWSRELRAEANRPSPWLSDFACAAVEQVLHAGVARDSCWYLDLADLTLSRHRFLPDPLCSICGTRPDDTAARAEIVLRERPKPAGATRIRELSEPLLTTLYADRDTGVVGPPTGWNDSLFPMAAVALAEYGYRGEAGFGRTRDFTSCRATAIAEALERLGGQWPWGKRTTVRGSYAELAADAVDPRTFGLCLPQRYLEPDSPYQPFTEDTVVNWVWAHSFRLGRPVLVPETHAYYRTDRRPGATPDKPFTFEISNGCALGGCLEEAILHGILEVIERDAFLLTWYARMPVPELDLARAPDPRIPLVVERIERTGYRARVFDMTLAEAIPAFWVLAQEATGDATRPQVVCTSGSALDPVGGVLTALHELAPVLDQEVRNYPAAAERGRQMVTDPGLVRSMSDHSLCNATPEAFDRFSFLLDGDRVIDWDQVSPWPWPRHTDLRDDVTAAIDRMLVGGMDVIVVDQTASLHEPAGLRCVKVIAPGSLSMTFGHGNRRITGLPRLYEIPYRLGHASRPLTDADLNPDPHPFP